MTSSQHHHEESPVFSVFPEEDMIPLVSGIIAGFPGPNPAPVTTGLPARPHVGGVNDAWIFDAVKRHPAARAESLRTIIAGILRTPWWDAQTHPPETDTGDPFDGLVEGPNYRICTLCGSNNGKTCVKTHLDYHPQ